MVHIATHMLDPQTLRYDQQLAFSLVLLPLNLSLQDLKFGLVPVQLDLNCEALL